ncbi:MAG: YgiT-type zinc finger protein [Acidobacteriota bacterium]
MICRTCGGALRSRVTDLPFKVADTSIVILKGLPVLQCSQCQETELDHPLMVEVERILASFDQTTELEIIRYAA